MNFTLMAALGMLCGSSSLFAGEAQEDVAVQLSPLTKKQHAQKCEIMEMISILHMIVAEADLKKEFA